MLFFAYGAALSRRYMAERCPGCKPKVSAALPHYQLSFTGWSRVFRGGTASLKPLRGSQVKGGIYEVPEAWLKKLDAAEGFPAQNAKINLVVNTETGESISCFTYVPAHQTAESKPAPEYLAILQQGYRDWGLV
ncbi:gamma-glutamylcyclotransferase family protein [Dehalogenimonas alkenigignens]|uniref:AIG2-like family n=1 Tax=Dehalogenimonas alkenigignens TaxID=1217799 RepID=A0A0W0GGB6_9CHLR|nr:gamma-glutamylcyclotransferase family protein [Dehalogenimonas alkenigignens]KTB47594.1 AIG2-like family [Dehalogenimonas alkenigignens]PVV82864.1 gamma-glutamylcyclotransferase [Dehalogenimonas alkenigignens]